MSKPIYFSGAIAGGPPQPALPSVGDKYLPLSSMSAESRMQVFGLWMGIVYFNRIPPPARLDWGFYAHEGPILVWEFQKDYEAGAWRKLGRGLTLEEAWFSRELSLGEPFMCLVSSAAPKQPTERIERKIILDATRGVEIALAYFRHKASGRRHPLTALVTDGAFGHAITLFDADPTGTRLAFHDPWPGRSLLCEENNTAGVKALFLGKGKLHFSEGRTVDVDSWQLDREELIRVLVALMICLKSTQCFRSER